MLTIIRRGLVVVAIALFAFAVASCSSGSKSGTPPTTNAPAPTTVPMTKAAYLARANALCRTMNARVAGLGRSTNARTIASTAAIDAATLHQLRALTVPPGEGSALSAVYEKVDLVVKDLTQWSAALRTGNQAAAQQASSKLQTDGNAANAASNAYGLTACGS